MWKSFYINLEQYITVQFLILIIEISFISLIFIPDEGDFWDKSLFVDYIVEEEFKKMK
jgi:hypothetical protein